MEGTTIGRRRRRVVRIYRRTLPTIFQCPKCGNNAVGITMMKERALVQCGNCGLKEEIPATPSNKPVDIFCKFIDHFYRGEKAA